MKYIDTTSGFASSQKICNILILELLNSDSQRKALTRHLQFKGCSPLQSERSEANFGKLTVG
jgi:hypothetical protein